MSRLNARALEPFGFEVDLAGIPEPGSPEARELGDLYQRDGLLVARGLTLSQADQLRLCRLLGPVSESPYDTFTVSNVDAEGFLGQRDLLWHNDVPFLPSPYHGAALHALTVEGRVVSTRFASGYRGYERLPDGLKQRLAGLKALHVRERVLDRPTRLDDLLDGDICAVHSLVRTNKTTKRKYLFINQAWMDHVIGLGAEENAALLKELSARFYADDNVYEHRWQPGDLVIWDNLALNHARGPATEGTRTLQRTTITEFGYLEQYPAGLAIAEELHNETMLA
ncbi:MAG: TauD/TfdA family dioxygenase [Sphingomonadales bacterium]|nr:TauD/TfdA family dioxygenase [Sphingomonadales bacterium]